MNKLFQFLACSIILWSCDITVDTNSGNGNVIKEERKLPDFQALKASGSIDVEIIPAEAFSVVVENDENLLDYVITEVKGGVLNVYYKNGMYLNGHAKVYISAPSLNEITSSGSADIDIRETLQNDKQIRVRSSGSGDISGNVEAPAINILTSGSGDIKLSGKTREFTSESSGSGDVNCENLKSEKAEVKISGSSDVKVFASVGLKVSISGSGDVFYSGNPPNPEIRTSGSGEAMAR